MAISRKAKETAGETQATRFKEIKNVHKLAHFLAREEYEITLEDASSDEEREQAGLILEAAKTAANLRHNDDYRGAVIDHQCALRIADEECDRAMRPFNIEYSAAVNEHKQAFALVDRAAQDVCVATIDRAYKERSQSDQEAEAAHKEQFLLIEQQYAIERRSRIVTLRFGRKLIETYFDSASKLTPPDCNHLRNA